MCKFKVSGHRHEGLGTNNLPSIEKDEVPVESKPEPNQTVPSVDCVLCTFKVAGHVHGGKPPPPLPLTVDEESAHLASMLATTQIGMPPSEEVRLSIQRSIRSILTSQKPISRIWVQQDGRIWMKLSKG